MVTLDDQFVEKHQINRTTRSKFRTHLYMNNRKINEIGIIRRYSRISVAYLHNNVIEDVTKLCSLKNLTHLYLQWNNLRSTESINDLPNLTHLYLGYNFVSVVNGLKGIPHLQLLHLQKQRGIQDGSSLNFHSETISALSKSLLELNVSGNNLSTLKDLQLLSNLEVVDCSDNLLSNIDDICNAVHTWRRVKILNLRDNLLNKRRKYEYDVIAASARLELLNDKPVSNVTRVFLQSLYEVRNKRQKKRNIERTEFSPETRSFVRQLPLEFRKIVSRSIIHKRNGNIATD